MVLTRPGHRIILPPWVRASGRRVQVAGSSFSPLDISGCVAYYNAQVLSSLWQDSARTTQVSADGDPIGAWDDLSGEGNHLLQTTTGEKPTYDEDGINSLGSLLHDGGDRFLLTSFSGGAAGPPATLFAVIQLGTDGTATLMCGQSNIYQIDVASGPVWSVSFGGAATGGTPDTSLHLLVALLSSSEKTLWVDGTQVLTDTGSASAISGLCTARTAGAFKPRAGTRYGAMGHYDGDIGSAGRAQLLAWAQSEFGTP